MKPLIIIAGPTGVGKTDLAIWLAGQLKTEIISADSMQVYKYMDIGTAKPTPQEQQLAKHHLIDLVEPDYNFTVADYQARFTEIVASFKEAQKVPLVVGGTGLYIRACTQSFALDNPADPDWGFRKKLKSEAEVHGNLYLHNKLAKIDPEAASRIHPNDLVRVIRALEVFEKTGIPITQIQTKNTQKYPTIYLFIERHREELYARIDQRVDQMINQGLLKEVELLRTQFSPELKPMQGLGYKQLNDYLDNKCSFQDAVNSIKQKTRNYAKRQITWFNREPIDWRINLSEKREEFYGEILKYIEGRLNIDVE